MNKLRVVTSGPLWSSGPVADQDFAPEGLSIIISAFGGFWSAKFSISGKQGEIDWWLQNGLGLHVEIYDEQTGVVWEGFVDRLSGNVGSLSFSLGPLTDIANRVRLVYSTIYVDADTGETVLGERERTDWANDTDSQARWAIIPKILSSAGSTADNAEDMRDRFLAERAWPRSMSRRWSSQTPGQSSVTVECLGYVHFLNYPYYSTTTGTQGLSVKLAAILTYNPNSSWLTFDTRHLDTNTGIVVPAYEQKDRIALTLIKDIVARGDSNYNRWLFGVYENRRVYYQQAPDTIGYYQRLSDGNVRVDTQSGGSVLYWNVRPGAWVFFPDFLTGATEKADLRADHRAMFVESSNFMDPDELTLEGGDVDRLSQLLAQLGLAGIGA